MPETEARLKELLGSSYRLTDWKPAFDAVFNAEDDTVAAVAAVRALASAAQALQPVPTSTAPTPTITAPAPSIATLSQLDEYEKDLMSSVDELFRRRRIRGECPTIDELLNLAEEKEIGESPYAFPGGDSEIVAKVREGMSATANPHETNDRNEDSDEDPELELPSPREAIGLCEQLEKLCIAHSDAHGVSALLLQTQLRRLRRHLRALDMASHTQVTLDKFWNNRVPA